MYLFFLFFITHFIFWMIFDPHCNIYIDICLGRSVIFVLFLTFTKENLK